MSERKFFLGLSYVTLCLVGIGCGSSQSVPKNETSGADVLKSSQGTSDDASRCEYKNRADREARESAGIGSIRPNIRRVYAIVGEGDERRQVLSCREVDTNLDGVKDVIRTFNEKGESLREIADADYDGKLDTWVTFSAGRMGKVDIDTNRDGNADEFRYYVKGKLSRVQRDSNFDAKPDVWEIYEDGELRRIGLDLDFDGHVDRWDRDEVAERAALEREVQEEEKRKKAQAAAGGEEDSAAGGKPATPKDDPKTTAGGASGKSTAPVNGYVSPRNR